ncbi:MAG TPA: TlpA disulfide reductase family protein [Acidobacteriaceae bacterium]
MLTTLPIHLPALRRTAALFAFAAALLLSSAGCDRNAKPHQLGKPAPDFTINDSGQTVHLASYKGKVVILNFWATWCGPCRQELPTLVTLAQQMPQVTVIAVSADDDATAYTNFLASHPMPGIVTIRDTTQHSNELYGSFAFPETYVIDRNGVLRRKFVGSQVWTSPELADYLNKL